MDSFVERYVQQSNMESVQCDDHMTTCEWRFRYFQLAKNEREKEKIEKKKTKENVKTNNINLYLFTLKMS